MLERFRRLLSPASIRTLSSLESYARWAASYPPQAHNLLMQTEEAAMLSLMPDLTAKTVLDLACGTGRYAIIAQSRGAKRVLGLDNSLAMLQANSHPQVALATSEALPIPAHSIDVILCGLALGHLPDLSPSLREIARVLRPGGTALISDFHPFAFLNGGKRTFTAPDGATYAVEHYAHLYADYHRAAHENGLHIDSVIEPGAEFNEKNRTGRAAPIIIVYRLLKR